MPPRIYDERGDVGSALLLMLATIQVVLMVFHASLVFHGRQVATSAAQEALGTAQLLEGDIDAGKAAGDNVLAISGGLFVASNVNIVVDSPGMMTVTVTAEVDTKLFPYVNDVTVKVSGPRERLLAERERQ